MYRRNSLVVVMYCGVEEDDIIALHAQDKYFEDSDRKQKEDDDGYSDESFAGDTFIERKRIDAGSPTICSDEEFYSDDNLASDSHRH